jgi:hypothetical protein
LDGQDPVGAALGEVGDVLPLAVHCVNGDHGVAQVSEMVEQWTEAGDLVGMTVDVGAGQHNAGVLVASSQHVPGGRVAAAGSAQGLAVDRDRPPGRYSRGPGPRGEPAADDGGELVRVQGLQQSTNHRFGRSPLGVDAQGEDRRGGNVTDPLGDRRIRAVAGDHGTDSGAHHDR